MQDEHEDYFIVEPPMGAGTRALMWGLITLVVCGASYIVGSILYWIIRSVPHG